MDAEQQRIIEPPAPSPGGPFAHVANFLAAIGTVWIFLLMFLIVADVVGRNFLNAPITGVAEIAGHSVIAIVFLQISSAVLADRITTADFLARIMRRGVPGLARLLDTLFLLVGALVFAAIIYASWSETLSTWRTGEFFGVRGVFTVPIFPFRAIMVLGSFAAVIAYLILALRRARATAGPEATS